MKEDTFGADFIAMGSRALAKPTEDRRAGEHAGAPHASGMRISIRRTTARERKTSTLSQLQSFISISSTAAEARTSSAISLAVYGAS